MPSKILAIDDDDHLLRSIKKNLSLRGYQVNTINNPTHALNEIQSTQYHCVLLDVKMPGMNGMDLLKELTTEFPTLPVIMISGQSTISAAVETLKQGAYDFIEKPIEPQKLATTIANAIEHQRLLSAKNILFAELKQTYKMVGESAALEVITQQINKIADTDATVLIQGESGTGKELVAWAIHHSSTRNGKPYVKLNCAAIPGELQESELFGYRKGAFTGADRDYKGKFLYADQGTIFLDEIGDMSLGLQAKLLRVFETKEVERIGDETPHFVDVRIVAATNKDLPQFIKEGHFREDLYFRLNVLSIRIPPLRERREDILPLTYHFLKVHNENHNRRVWKISRRAEALLKNYSWRGNVRQLRNVIEKLVIMSDTSEIGVDELRNALDGKDVVSETELNNNLHGKTLRAAKLQFERDFILRKLNENSWSIQDTASALGIDRTNLFRKMQRLEINK